MKLALMPGDLLSPAEMRSEGFEAVQMFFGGGADGDATDPSVEGIDKVLQAADIALAAMTLHVDLVGPKGMVREDVERLVRCVEKTAALEGRFGDNPRPVLVWHPSGYPEEGVDDQALFEGLCAGLTTACATAERLGIVIAVEMTRAGSVDGAERFLRVQDRVGSKALKVCMDAANFAPDRTPLVRRGADARSRYCNRPRQGCALCRERRGHRLRADGVGGAWTIRPISARCRSGRRCPISSLSTTEVAMTC